MAQLVPKSGDFEANAVVVARAVCNLELYLYRSGSLWDAIVQLQVVRIIALGR